MGKKSRKKRDEQKTPLVVAKSGLEKACVFIIRYGTYLVLFAPLWIFKYSFFPFVTPKTILFRVIVEIIFAAYLILAISIPKYRPRKNALLIAIALFLAILILTSITGINFARSFWSTHERMTGLLTMFHLFAFFIVLSSVFKHRKDWEKILAVSIFVGVVLSLYVLFSDQASTRGGGTIGNGSFMAAYLLFSVFFALILFLTKKGGWRIYTSISLIVLIWNLLTSDSRGVIFSFWIGIGLLILSYLFFSQKKLLKRIGLGLILFLLISSVILAVVQSGFVKDKMSHTLGEMGSRFVVWRAGWQAWQERFWLGWGPENFNVGFSRYFNPCMFINECGNEIWFDRTHNIVLDTTTSSGLIGLLSYLSIFAVAIFGLLRACKRVVEKRNVFIPLGMAVLLLVYFAQNLLVFDMINTYLMFFLSLAFIVFLTSKEEDESQKETKTQIRPINPFFTGAIVIGLIFSLWVFNIQPLLAACNTAKMIAYSQRPDVANVLFEKSLNSWMLKYETREQFGQMVSRYTAETGESREAVQASFELAIKEMEKSIQKNPIDFRHHLFLGRLYTSYYYFSPNQAILERAQEVLEKSIELSPSNQQGYWYLSEVKFAEKKYKEAIDLLKKAVELEPRFGQSYWYLVIAYHLDGDLQSALEQVQKTEQVRYPYDWRINQDNIKRVLSIYNALNDTDNLLSLHEEAVELHPQESQFWANLAQLYANAGRFSEARQTAEKLLELQPDLEQDIQNFLNQLP